MKSISEYFVALSGSAVSRSSKKHRVFALSSKRAEFIALAVSIKETLWFKKFGTLFEIAIENNDLRNLFSISVREINMDCIRDAQNPVVSELSKRVDMKYQFTIDNG